MTFRFSRHNEFQYPPACFGFLAGIAAALLLIVVCGGSFADPDALFWSGFWTKKPGLWSFCLGAAQLSLLIVLRAALVKRSGRLFACFLAQGMFFCLACVSLCGSSAPCGIYLCVFSVVLPAVVLYASQFWILGAAAIGKKELLFCLLLAGGLFLSRYFGFLLGRWLYLH